MVTLDPRHVFSEVAKSWQKLNSTDELDKLHQERHPPKGNLAVKGENSKTTSLFGIQYIGKKKRQTRPPTRLGGCVARFSMTVSQIEFQRIDYRTNFFDFCSVSNSFPKSRFDPTFHAYAMYMRQSFGVAPQETLIIGFKGILHPLCINPNFLPGWSSYSHSLNIHPIDLNEL